MEESTRVLIDVKSARGPSPRPCPKQQAPPAYYPLYRLTTIDVKFRGHVTCSFTVGRILLLLVRRQLSPGPDNNQSSQMSGRWQLVCEDVKLWLVEPELALKKWASDERFSVARSVLESAPPYSAAAQFVPHTGNITVERTCRSRFLNILFTKNFYEYPKPELQVGTRYIRVPGIFRHYHIS